MEKENAQKLRPLLLVIAIQMLLYLLLLGKSASAASHYVTVLAGIVLVETGLAFWLMKRNGSLPILYATAMIFAIGTCVQCLLSPIFPTIRIELYGVVTVIAGILFSLAFARIFPKGKAPRWVYGLVFLGIAVIYGLLMTVGTDPNNTGTTNTLEIGSITVQPTEFIKVIAAVFYAMLFADPKIQDKVKVIASTAFFLVNLLCLLFIKELGSMLVLIILHILMLWVFLKPSKMKKIYLSVCMGLILAGVALLVFHPYLKEMRFAFPGSERIYSYIDKIYIRYQMAYNLDALDLNNEGFQMNQARQAMILGGLLGSNLPISIPVADSDFVFTYVILNFGALTGMGLLLLYVAFAYAGYSASGRQKGFHQAFVFAATTLFAMQGFLNISMSTGLIPLAGIGLPLVSAGGSYELVCMVLVITMASLPEGKVQK